ncbi:MAG: mannitol dehydrogenase family protein [Defluviitaleaceae bacterium]|nr:mannitol dehydrogenase family protein [Defluviitaleaceae bacterium]MCL2274977.1 mannitol dehydrogenase family protein [Defluviitaleaceae bacterium]
MGVRWLQMGAGNIFRVFVAAVQQDLLDAGLTDTGITVCECFDEEIIPAVLTPFNNETLGVTLHVDGRLETRKIASIQEAFGRDLPRLKEIIANPELQIISVIITEKGYTVSPANIAPAPANAQSTLEYVTAGLLARFEKNAPPLALVSMDNFAANGDVLKKSLQTIANAWADNGSAPAAFAEYVAKQAYPWTMIDKITPHPGEKVAEALRSQGFSAEQARITKTGKGTVTAPFVNAEAAQYLIMEDAFPNGRPPFEKLPNAGVYLTDRETVRKVDHMKVCACLNPLHTILAVSGMLLNYPTISACMQDEGLVRLIRKAAAEALPVVANPVIIDPQQFLEEVLTRRFPNPFIPDAPARIATDTSQKIPVRFGQTLQARQKAGLPMGELTAIPLLVALWLRYRMGIDDTGAKLILSPDPLVPAEVAKLEGSPFGSAPDLRPILSNSQQFGVDLYAAGLGEKIESLFLQLSKEANAVKNVLINHG